MKICFFGAYDRNFTSNLIVLRGLKLNGAMITEVNAHVPLTKLVAKEDISFMQLVKRIFKKWKIIAEIIRHWKDLRTCEWIYVGFPGHFDVLIAYPLAKLLKKKLVFNPLVIFYTGFVNDQRILSSDSFLAKALKTGERLIYHLCDLVIADTSFQAEHLHSLFGIPYSKIKTVAIGADNKVYKNLPKPTADSNFNVVYYGLYTPLHGVKYIIHAAKKCEKVKDLRFLMVGKGNTYEESRRLADSLKTQNIKFYPNMTEVDAFETLSHADVFLGFLQKHPSVDRIIPNKVYQGLAMGKAVISGDTPVMREVFTHKKNVYLCKLSDADDLASSILELYRNRKLTQKIAQNGYTIFKEKFTPKIIGKNIIQALESVAA